MPFLQSRRTRLALLAILVLFAFVATPTLARAPYEMNDATEGDPGDGVLSPRLAELSSEGMPPTGDLRIAAPIGDRSTEPPAPRAWYFPWAVHVPLVGWYTAAPLWLFLEGRWTHAP